MVTTDTRNGHVHVEEPAAGDRTQRIREAQAHRDRAVADFQEAWRQFRERGHNMVEAWRALDATYTDSHNALVAELQDAEESNQRLTDDLEDVRFDLQHARMELELLRRHATAAARRVGLVALPAERPVANGGDWGTCSECGSPLVRRTNRVTGDEFLGCSSWPACASRTIRLAGDQPMPSLSPGFRADWLEAGDTEQGLRQRVQNAVPDDGSEVTVRDLVNATHVIENAVRWVLKNTPELYEHRTDPGLKSRQLWRKRATT